MGWRLDSCFNLDCNPAGRYIAETMYCAKDQFTVNYNAELLELNMQRELRTQGTHVSRSRRVSRHC